MELIVIRRDRTGWNGTNMTLRDGTGEWDGTGNKERDWADGTKRDQRERVKWDGTDTPDPSSPVLSALSRHVTSCRSHPFPFRLVMSFPSHSCPPWVACRQR